MSKKLAAACMALAAFAVFVAGPTTASARVLTHPTGTALAKGSKLTFTQVGAMKITNTTGSSILECSKSTMTGTLTKNEGGTIEGEIESAILGGTGPQAAGEPSTECTGTGFFSFNQSYTFQVLPWCISSTAVLGEEEFQVRGGKCSEGGKKIKFAMVTTGIGTCEYEATQTSIKGSIQKDKVGEDAILTPFATNTNAGFKLFAGGGLCPTSIQFDTSFTLETDKTTAEPIYFS